MIEVGVKPIIMWDTKNILPKTFKMTPRIVVAIRWDQDERFEVAHNCSYAENLTAGAACTCVLARNHKNNDWPFVIVNSDQFIEWDSDFFWAQMFSKTKADCCIMCLKLEASDQKSSTLPECR